MRSSLRFAALIDVALPLSIPVALDSVSGKRDPLRRFVLRLAALLGVSVLFSLQATAVPTTITSGPTALPTGCDPLVAPSLVDELGNVPPFPFGEQIASVQLAPTTVNPCPTALPGDNPFLPNRVIRIQNLNWDPVLQLGIGFSELWYVADPETFLRNVDGIINGAAALKIDAVWNDPLGLNRPLIAESYVNDGIFMPLETWTFVLQDWANNQVVSPGPPAVTTSPAAFGSIGVGTGSLGTIPSSGSIIGIPFSTSVPEPTTAALLGLGLLALGVARRRAG